MSLHHEVLPVNQNKCHWIDGNDSASSAVRERLIDVDIERGRLHAWP